MGHPPQLPGQCLDVDDKPADLNAAAGGACAGAYEHQHDQYRAAVAGPEVKVRGGVTGGGHHRGDAEECVHGLCVIPQDSGMTQIKQNGDGCKEEHDQIPADLLHFYGVLEFSQNHQVVEIEVHAEQGHENGGDPFAEHGVFRIAGIQHTEAAGTGCAKGQTQRLEGVHFADAQQDKVHNGQSQIDAVEPNGRLPQLRHQLTHRGAGGFCPHQVEVLPPCHGENGQHKHQNAHAANPVGKAPPEQHTVIHGFYFIQNAGAGGGKA